MVTADHVSGATTIDAITADCQSLLNIFITKTKNRLAPVQHSKDQG
jgi:hypothetical protein